ncbi:MAG: hypothetical protein ABIA04_13980 [Pseudomonadota bacterium]
MLARKLIGSSWEIFTLYANINVLDSTQMYIDRRGSLHITAIDIQNPMVNEDEAQVSKGDLYYIKIIDPTLNPEEAVNQEVEMIRPSEVTVVSAIFFQEARMHIFFCEHDSNIVKHGSRRINGGNWRFREALNDVLITDKLKAFDIAGEIFLAYINDLTHKLTVAQGDFQSLTFTETVINTVDTPEGGYANGFDVMVDSQDNLQILYSADSLAGDDLRYAVGQPGSFNDSLIITTIGGISQIAMSLNNDNPLFLVRHPAFLDNISLFVNNNLGWSFTPLVSVFNTSSFDMVVNQKTALAHIAFHEQNIFPIPGDDTIYYMSVEIENPPEGDGDGDPDPEPEPLPLTIETLDAGGEFSAIAIDPQNNEPVVRYDTGSGVLRIRKIQQELYYDYNSNGGDHAVIAIGSDNKVKTSFYTNNTRWGHTILNPDGTYDVSSLGSSEAIESNNIDIDIDGANDIHYTYYWRGNLYHTVVSDEGGHHTDDVFDDGLWPSVDVDADSHPHISFSYDGELRYITGEIGHVDLDLNDMETVDSVDVLYTAIYTDSLKLPHIVYIDNNTGTLKYAHKDQLGVWLIDNIAMNVDTGDSRPDLVLDSNDKAHVVYYNAGNGDLNYITNLDNSWEEYVLDEAGNVGLGPKIAADINNDIHISYHDADNQTLKYAKIDY